MRTNSRLILTTCLLIVLSLIVYSSIGYSFIFNCPEVIIVDRSANERDLFSLLQVIVGGSIGIIGSVIGAVIVSLLRSRNERRTFLRSKSEEILYLAYQCDEWLDKLILGYLIQGDIDTIFKKYPVNRLKVLQTKYFPTLKDDVDSLLASVKEFRTAIISERNDFIKVKEYSPEFKKKYDPLQSNVLKSIAEIEKKVALLKYV